MPHVNILEPKKHAYRILIGQLPLTHFKDYRKSIQVKLLKYDDRKSMLNGTYDFIKATWSEDGKESERASEADKLDALNQMLSGKTLSLGLETINLMFRIGGISRVDTHQIIRQRVGVTFSQQCTGDRFLHHNNALVEECIAAKPKLLKKFINATLVCKNTYADLANSGISVQVVREILPHNEETFIFMNTNLQTLLFFFQKRIEDGSQTWQMNEISKQMASEVCKVYPELRTVFDRFSTTFKLQRDQSADRKNLYSSSLYVPKVDEFEYNTRDFLYNQKKEDMLFTHTPIEDIYYWEYNKLTEDQYVTIKEIYNQLDIRIKEKHGISNNEIKAMAEQTNAQIRSVYGF